MESNTTLFFPIWARCASPFLVWSDCSGVNISILVKRKYNKMWTGSIGCLCCVNITVPSFDVNPNSLLPRDTFFVKIFQLYKVRTVEISKIEIHIKLWAFEVVPFHFIYLDEIKIEKLICLLFLARASVARLTNSRR